MADRKQTGQILIEALVVLLLLSLCFVTILQGLKSFQRQNRTMSLSREAKHEARFHQKISK